MARILRSSAVEGVRGPRPHPKGKHFNTGRIDHIYTDPHSPSARLFLHYGDLSDSGQLANLIYNIQPEEVYHLAAQSHVKVSFDMPEYTGDSTALGTTRLLEAIRRSGIKTKYYQASSSEMFGAAPPPQSEQTPFHPEESVRGRQTLRLLDDGQLPRRVWSFRVQRHSLQPRISAPGRDLCDKENHPGSSEHT